MDPHPDVRDSRYQEAEFADLAEVVHGTADPEYQDPTEFFKRTYLTDGMVGLLANAAKRLSGEGGRRSRHQPKICQEGFTASSR